MGISKSKKIPLICVCFCVWMMIQVVNSSKFDELFQPSWASEHLIYEGDLLKLKLDNFSGT